MFSRRACFRILYYSIRSFLRSLIASILALRFILRAYLFSYLVIGLPPDMTSSPLSMSS